MQSVSNLFKYTTALLMTLFTLGCSNQPQTMTQQEKPMARGIPKISVQLWSVNEQIKQDFKGTLTALANMGFEGVEFAGYFGPYKDDPAGLKAFLDGLGLAVSGAHVSMRHLTDENYEKTVSYYAAINTPMLIVPNSKKAYDPELIDGFIQQMKVVANKLSTRGIGFGFHNHARELKPYKDTTFWDHIATSTADDFILQLDVGWATYAGVDAAAYVRKYPGRTLTTHYKAKYTDDVTGKQPFIGEDITDWPAVIRANVEAGGTLWMVVEQEEYPNNMSQLDSVARSKQGLDRILRSL